MRFVMQGAGAGDGFACLLEPAMQIEPIGTCIEGNGIFQPFAALELFDHLVARRTDFGHAVLGGIGENARVVVNAPGLLGGILPLENRTAHGDDAIGLREVAPEPIGDDGRVQDGFVVLDRLGRKPVGIAHDEVQPFLGDEPVYDFVEKARRRLLVVRLDIVDDRFFAEAMRRIPAGNPVVMGQDFRLRHLAPQAREQHLAEYRVETEPATVEIDGCEEEAQMLYLMQAGLAIGAVGNMFEKLRADALGHAGFEQYSLEIGGKIFEDIGGKEIDEIRRDARSGQRPRPSRSSAHGKADALERGRPAIRRGLVAIDFLIRDVAKLAEELRRLVGAEAEPLDIHHDGLLAKLETRKIDRGNDAGSDAELDALRHDTDELGDDGFHARMGRLLEIVDDDDKPVLHGLHGAEEILHGGG